MRPVYDQRSIKLALTAVPVSALLVGFFAATLSCVRQSFSIGLEAAIARYRRRLGCTVPIGLGILFAATIIKTIMREPTGEGFGSSPS